RRNEQRRSVRFTVTVNHSQDAVKRGAVVTVVPEDAPNMEFLYVVTEETLFSGRKLRTYFDVSMKTDVYWVPEYFFAAEKECLRHMQEVLDYMNSHYSESQQHLPPNVPIEGHRVRLFYQRAQATMPREFAEALHALGRSHRVD